MAARFTEEGQKVGDWGTYDLVQIRAILNITESSTVEEARVKYDEYREQISIVRLNRYWLVCCRLRF